MFAAEDLLETLDNPALLERRLLLDKNHLLDHQLKVRDGGWVSCSQHLRASAGLPFAGNVDVYVSSLLARCDGRRTLREIIVDIADHMTTDAERLIPDCLSVVSRLMRCGFLSAADDASG